MLWSFAVTQAGFVRWQQAQAAEVEWWQNWTRLPFYRTHSFPNYWSRALTGLLGDLETLKPGVVVEIGCGPHGVVRYLFDSAQVKLGIDPLIHQFRERPSPKAQTTYAAAIGESIPVKDNSVDLVVCVNVLDHVMDADRILGETRRLLKPEGSLVLELLTFPPVLKPFLFFDPAHTAHWTERDLRGLIERAGFRVNASQSLRFPAELTWRSVFTPAHWKYAFGKAFLRLSWMDCSRGL